MRPSRLISFTYWILLVLMVAQSSWWVIYLSREGDRYFELQQQRFQADRLHAAYLMRTYPEIAEDPEAHLRETFPNLHFNRLDNAWDIHIDSSVEEATRKEAKRRSAMFLGEGVFFLALILAGSALLTLAYRREMSFRRTRELFLAGVSHEFRTPLASLQLYAETLERPDLDELRRDEILRHMQEDVSRLDGMVGQVLAASRAESPLGAEPEALDVKFEAEEILRGLQAFFTSEGAQVHSELGQGCRIYGDRQLFSVALRNLLENAVKYSPKPARVYLDIESTLAYCRISVRDAGPGIPRNLRRKIFQSFFRVGEAGRRPGGMRGTGLGLYLVKRAAQELGGKIELESKVGEGSTFTLVLPIAKETP
ncbi:HAMP domain-containing histidine kinase [bacterium]|nr:HAMP domain-containing histidine kinase [bacterium]